MLGMYRFHDPSKGYELPEIIGMPIHIGRLCANLAVREVWVVRRLEGVNSYSDLHMDDH